MMSAVFQQNRWLLIGGFCVLLGYAFGISYFCDSWKTLNSITLKVPDCDLDQGPCTSVLPTGESITLAITPTHMPVLTSVQLKVKTEKIRPTKVMVNFKGVEMNMGEFRYTLLPQTDGSFSTQTTLPTCIHEQMVWHAVIQVETSNQHFSAPFIFINKRNNLSHSCH